MHKNKLPGSTSCQKSTEMGQVLTRRAVRVAYAETHPLGLTDLPTDLCESIFSGMAAQGDAHFLSRAAVLNKAHKAAVEAAWPSLRVPVPKMVAAALLDEIHIGDSLPNARVNKARVHSLELVSGRNLLQLGVSQKCMDCERLTRVPDWEQACEACFIDARIERWPSEQAWTKTSQQARHDWFAEKHGQLSMWQCRGCGVFNPDAAGGHKGVGQACSSCHKMYHRSCNSTCGGCGYHRHCCCDCAEWGVNDEEEDKEDEDEDEDEEEE